MLVRRCQTFWRRAPFVRRSDCFCAMKMHLRYDIATCKGKRGIMLLSHFSNLVEGYFSQTHKWDNFIILVALIKKIIIIYNIALAQYHFRDNNIDFYQTNIFEMVNISNWIKLLNSFSSIFGAECEPKIFGDFRNAE